MNKEKEPLAITPETIIKEKHLISRGTLVERAAALKGLTLAQKDEFYLSKEIGQIPFDEGFKSALSKYGFEVVDRKEDKLITISSKIKDEGNPELSDWWNIKKTGASHSILPNVKFDISDFERGVLLKPYIWFSETIIGPGNQLTHNRMAKAIVSLYPDKETPSILKEIVENDCKLTVFWEEINAAGARTVAQLFKEWAHENEGIKALSHSSVSPFNPSPKRHFALEYKENIASFYLPEKLHGVLFAQWEKQLKVFKAIL